MTVEAWREAASKWAKYIEQYQKQPDSIEVIQARQRAMNERLGISNDFWTVRKGNNIFVYLCALIVATLICNH